MHDFFANNPKAQELLWKHGFGFISSYGWWLRITNIIIFVGHCPSKADQNGEPAKKLVALCTKWRELVAAGDTEGQLRTYVEHQGVCSDYCVKGGSKDW